MRSSFIQTLQDYTQDAVTAQSLGAAMLQCNAMIVPEIAPQLALLISNFSRPVVTNNESADWNTAGGAQFHTAGAPKNRYEGQWQMIETDLGQVTGFSELVQGVGGMTNCIIYMGRKGRYTEAHELKDCALTFEPMDIEGESVSSIIRVQVSCKYNYYGVNASLGTSTQLGLISGASDGINGFLKTANQVLNVVSAGNTLIKAIASIF